MSVNNLNTITPNSVQWQDLPSEIQHQGDLYWQTLSSRSDIVTHLTPPQIERIKWHFSMSQFIAEAAIKEPEYLLEIVNNEHNPIANQTRLSDIERTLTALITDVQSEDQLKHTLRKIRRQEMLHIAWRDMNGQASLDESFTHISGLADLLISTATEWLYNHYSISLGTPCDEHGNPQPLYVLGMGKLGGKELNFSSDIDLIFCYPESGETQGGKKNLDNQQFFLRLGQKLINALGQSTLDGFVYRVDMRLRPYGESGPLAMSYSMLEDYYQSQGRDWERYAMIKARIIAPKVWQQQTEYQALYELFRPFVYRKYIDFSAIDSLRKMKKLISQEIRRKGLKDNIKLGEGGIREVEFIAQAYQLIRGGQIPELRLHSTRKTLNTLVELNEIPAQERDELLSAYHFLRKTEHILQELNDAQTQTLPIDKNDQTRLALLMGFTDYSTFYNELNQWHAKIHQYFNALIADPEDQYDAEAHFDYWIDGLTEEALSDQLSTTNSNINGSNFYQLLQDCKLELTKRRVGPRGREVLQRLMPLLIEQILETDDPVMIMTRVSKFIATIATRTAYLELLIENYFASKQLIALLGASPWIFEQLCKHPILLDEMIDPKQLVKTYSREEYSDELRQKLLRVEPDDLEQQMEVVRQFKNAQQLHIAAADITGALPVKKVSDHLTWLAEAILTQVMHLVWGPLVAKHGTPSDLEQSDTITTCKKGFAIIGYGKMGGWELGYGSDLDLVFVHNQNSHGETNGNRPISVPQFYIRYAQKLIHFMTARTPSGTLYEIDMRLRPSGNSGLLVTSLAGFDEYQQTDAWTWEHQALVRSRAVVGDADLIESFNHVRHTILAKQRTHDDLQKDVRDMRHKMRKHLAKGDEHHFDLKQDTGGIADIEFITQFIVLLHSAHCNALTQWSDNVRILETAQQQGLLSEAETQTLLNSYLTLRNKGHELALAQQSVIAEGEQFKALRDAVSAIWNDKIELKN